MSDARDAYLRDHARREWLASIGLKCVLLVISAAAIWTLVRLDRLKAHLNETRSKPYTAETIAAHLRTASANPALQAEMEVLAAALKNVRPGRTFASTDEAFAAIYEHAPGEKTRRAEEAEIRKRYEAPLAAVNTALTSLLAQRTSSFDKDFSRQFGLRTSLISARAVELRDAQQSAAAIRSALKDAWDRSNPAQARVPYAYFQAKALNAAAKHMVDPDDPLSILYDVLWYAALIIGVLTFATLVLAPVFRAVPLNGADESWGEKLRSLLSRAPRALSAGSSLLAGAIGAAAIVGASAALPSSPLQETGFVAPPRAEEPKNAAAEKEKKPETDKSTPPPDTEVLTTIRNDITAIRNAIATLGPPVVVEPPRDDRVLTRVIELAENVESTVGGLHQQIGQAETDIGTEIGRARTSVEGKVAAVDARTQNVEAQLGGAGSRFDARAGEVESTAILPHRLGERPSLLASTFGFDRYEITPEAIAFLKKVGAPPDVEAAVNALGSARYSNDELRLALRARLCNPPSRNCDVYLAWRNTVLRAARTR